MNYAYEESMDRLNRLEAENEEKQQAALLHIINRAECIEEAILELLEELTDFHIGLKLPWQIDVALDRMRLQAIELVRIAEDNLKNE